VIVGDKGKPRVESPSGDYGIWEFQSQIEAIYLEKDSKRGLKGSTLWFIEEVGELIRALRRGERDNLEEEFADVFAWMASLASIEGVDLAKVVREKYGEGCPRCKETPCGCPE
jgi:NTP pyrophosphatase (non-canonical NTP hydrolase)